MSAFKEYSPYFDTFDFKESENDLSLASEFYLNEDNILNLIKAIGEDWNPRRVEPFDELNEENDIIIEPNKKYCHWSKKRKKLENT
jgi:hypothetical protein